MMDTDTHTDWITLYGRVATTRRNHRISSSCNFIYYEDQREIVGDGGKIQGERSKDGGENDDNVWCGDGNGRQGRPITSL